MTSTQKQETRKIDRAKIIDISVIRENRTMILQGILAFLFIALALYFIRHEQTELVQVKSTLKSASWLWVLLGIGLAGGFIVLQGVMYQYSFRAVGERVTLRSAMLLFVKRNFVSVFLPAGGISSLAFFTRAIEKQHVSKSKIHVASSIYGFVGILSVVLVALPALAYSLLANSLSSKVIYTFAGLLLLVGGLALAARSVMAEGWLYRLIVRLHPPFEAQYGELKAIRFRRGHFIRTVLVSIAIEFVGIAHLLIAMRALGYPLSVEGAVIGYIVSVMFLLISPFLRGLGAIELSMGFILTRYGFSTLEAVSVTFLYRFFEFWLLLIVGGFSFVFVRNNILLRVLPVGLTFSLGLVNLVSVLTPAIHSRLHLLRDFLPLYAIDLSNYAVFMVGIFLLLISAFLLKGVRSAWYLTVALAAVSAIGHLAKAMDYEEALLAGFTIVALLLTRRQYFVRNNARLTNMGINAALVAVGAVLVFGVVGFYFLDRRHFNIDFSLVQSIQYTLQNFVFYQADALVPADRFAQNFLYALNAAGGLTLGFLLYTLVHPYFFEVKTEEHEREAARQLVAKHGRSPLDYFKTYYDKSLFFSADGDAFVAYRPAGNYAVVLEDPVCANAEKMAEVIREFDSFCTANGMKSLFYRVPESSLPVYSQLKKKALLIGQEAVLDLPAFTIEGKAKKSIRTSSNKQKELGLVARVYEPPIKAGLLQKIHAVSVEWQKEREYDELVFSQGLFDAEELKNQTLITVEDAEEKILAFANIIPDYQPGDATYDLIRNAKGSPNGLLEFLMAELFFYLKDRGYQTANLGFAAMAGIEDGKNITEKGIRFAYEKLRSFARYKGLKEFKDKFDPTWKNKYLIYTHDYDLFSVPSVLKKVVKP